MKTTKIIAIAATILMCFPTLALLAQNPPNGPASGPIDGGISILLVGAAAMGYKKMKERKEAKKGE
jgi:hypothetical protein